MIVGGADNAMRRRRTPRTAIIERSGCEDIRPGDRREKLRATYAALSAPNTNRPDKPQHRKRHENSPYLDRPLVPLAVALRSMSADTEEKIRTAEPAEKDGLQRRAQVLRDWITPRSTTPL
jgi:hypothetical protein